MLLEINLLKRQSMKKILVVLSSSFFILLAYNNSADVNVEKAYSTNKANTNTAESNKVTTGKKSSSFLSRPANSVMGDGIYLYEDIRTNASSVGSRNFTGKTLPPLKMYCDPSQSFQKRYW